MRACEVTRDVVDPMLPTHWRRKRADRLKNWFTMLIEGLARMIGLADGCRWKSHGRDHFYQRATQLNTGYVFSEIDLIVRTVGRPRRTWDSDREFQRSALPRSCFARPPIMTFVSVSRYAGSDASSMLSLTQPVELFLISPIRRRVCTTN